MTFGRACIITAFAVAVYVLGAGLYGARTGKREWSVSARRGMYVIAGLAIAAFITVELAYVDSNFNFSVVALNSSTTTPLFYKVTAIWSSQAGSMLLWILVLGILASGALWMTRDTHREVGAWATVVLGAIATFFLSMMVFFPDADPFLRSSPVPLEGNGLAPLLRNPSMMFHPPMLYSGYVGFSIPFAFAIGALITRRVDASWIRSTRSFAMLAWTFLSVGVILGGRWSYTELGWGGYWGWDPVENASLLPWLTGTAFLHSIMVQERRGMLKVWNVSLITATFVLSLLGTFLVRSGILSSIHAFGQSTLAIPFLIFISFVIIGSTSLIVSRLPDLRSAHRLDSLFSREAMFLLNNFLLVGLAAVVMWGTYFPLISEAVTGTKAAVGPPWYGEYVTPLGIMLVLVSGIGPIIPWRRVNRAKVVSLFVAPAIAATVALVLTSLITGLFDSWSSSLLFAVAAFSLFVMIREFYSGARARQALEGGSFFPAFGRLVLRNRRRYGGYIVHVGILTLLVGVAASGAYSVSTERNIRVGETFSVGGYDVKYVRATSSASNEKLKFGVVLDVSKDGKRVATMRPSRNNYPVNSSGPGPVARYFEGEVTSEVALEAGPLRDLWSSVSPNTDVLKQAIAAAGRLPQIKTNRDLQAVAITAIVDSFPRTKPTARVLFVVNPLVTWVWIGSIILLLGAIVALWPAPDLLRSRLSSSAAARAARGASRRAPKPRPKPRTAEMTEVGPS
ncbi:MAG: heme lyase CcmF/NrfE family subunit [Solirubrobacterales bacterium]|nr:heme lyase CcmF/NrfE family subunit [Solirubrobacterales bacterium]